MKKALFCTIVFLSVFVSHLCAMHRKRSLSIHTGRRPERRVVDFKRRVLLMDKDLDYKLFSPDICDAINEFLRGWSVWLPQLKITFLLNSLRKKLSDNQSLLIEKVGNDKLEVTLFEEGKEEGFGDENRGKLETFTKIHSRPQGIVNCQPSPTTIWKPRDYWKNRVSREPHGYSSTDKNRSVFFIFLDEDNLGRRIQTD